MRAAAPHSALLAALALALALGGCGLGAGRPPGGVQLLVTRDFGAQVLVRSAAPHVAGAETVMRLLMRNASVQTRYSGGFVQAIDGLQGGHEGGAPVDWFYFVNGIQAPKGAAATNVHDGDRIWWDRHDWSQNLEVPAVVGSFPEPFLGGIEGKRLPVRVECEDVGGSACEAVTASLRHAGVPAAVSAPASTSGPGSLRVLVGTWARVGADPAAHAIGEGPHASGVYARFDAAGTSLTLLDAEGGAVSTLGPDAGLIAATRVGEATVPVWVVTGTDTAGVQRAAADFAEAPLRDRFALAVAPSGALALPQPAGAAG